MVSHQFFAHESCSDLLLGERSVCTMQTQPGKCLTGWNIKASLWVLRPDQFFIHQFDSLRPSSLKEEQFWTMFTSLQSLKKISESWFLSLTSCMGRDPIFGQMWLSHTDDQTREMKHCSVSIKHMMTRLAAAPIATLQDGTFPNYFMWGKALKRHLRVDARNATSVHAHSKWLFILTSCTIWMMFLPDYSPGTWWFYSWQSPW